MPTLPEVSFTNKSLVTFNDKPPVPEPWISNLAEGEVVPGYLMLADGEGQNDWRNEHIPPEWWETPTRIKRNMRPHVPQRIAILPDGSIHGEDETGTGLHAWFQPKPLIFKGNFHITIYFTGDTEEEIEFKRKMIWEALQEIMEAKDGGFMGLQYMKEQLLEMPQRSVAEFADVPRGGGFEYSGPIALVEHFPQFAAKVLELAEKYNVFYASTARIISGGQAMMFSISFAFNRADAGMMQRVKLALDEATSFALDMGAIPWKPNFKEQQMTLHKLDPQTRKLLLTIKKVLDPQGIMNPGNWEVSE